LCNLLTRAHTKVSCLEIEKTKLDEKLIGFWFNKDNHMNVMTVAQDCMASIEFDIKALEHSMWSIEEKVNFGLYNFLSYEFFKVGLCLLHSIV
jgi:hypothetical protein